MKKTTLSIVISLILLSENPLVYAQEDALFLDSYAISAHATTKRKWAPFHRLNPRLMKLGVNPMAIPNCNSAQVNQMTPEQIGAFEPENFADLPSTAVTGLTAQQLNKANKQALVGLKPHHVAQIPAPAFKGFTRYNLGGLAPEAIQAIAPEQVNEITPQEFRMMLARDIAKLLANLVQIHYVEQIQHFLPPGWALSKDKGLVRPIGAPIVLRPLPIAKIANLHIPEIPDLNLGFGLGCQVNKQGNALTGINEAMAATDFSVKQTENGVLKVEDPEGTELAFLPDSNNMVQGANHIEAGVEVDNKGQYVLVLTGGQHIPVHPAPKDPKGLLNVLPPQSVIQIGNRGQTRFQLAGGRTIMCGFDFLVNKAPTGSQPGVYIKGQPGVDERMTVVYEDGHAQEAYPTIQSPELFEQVALTFPGVEQFFTLTHGKMMVHYHGKPLMLKPTFDIKPAAVEPSETETIEPEEPENLVKPEIEIHEDGSLTFTNDKGDEQQFFVVDGVNETDIAAEPDETLPEDTGEIHDDSLPDETTVSDENEIATTNPEDTGEIHDDSLPDETTVSDENEIATTNPNDNETDQSETLENSSAIGSPENEGEIVADLNREDESGENPVTTVDPVLVKPSEEKKPVEEESADSVEPISETNADETLPTNEISPSDESETVETNSGDNEANENEASEMENTSIIDLEEDETGEAEALPSGMETTSTIDLEEDETAEAYLSENEPREIYLITDEYETEDSRDEDESIEDGTD